jgi:hypothetical protein
MLFACSAAGALRDGRLRNGVSREALSEAVFAAGD